MVHINTGTNVKSYIGDHEIIANGISPVSDIYKAKILIDDLTVEFNFINDSDKTVRKITQRVIDEKHLILDIFNFDNLQGSGITEPWVIGQKDGRKLFITLWVWAVNFEKTNDKVMSWTVLLGAATDNNNIDNG